MNQTLRKLMRPFGAVLGILLLAAALPAWAVVDGVNGTTFNLTAKADYISTGDGNNHWAWGYANGAGTMQYPGPTMIVQQGATVTVNLGNELPVPVSIVFPGQQNVSASGGAAGVITREAPPSGTVTYSFVASEPGTYLYHSGTQQHLQVEMGLVGALVVRPNVADPLHRAYTHAGTAFDREYLFVLTEIDPAIHAQVEMGQMVLVDNAKRHSTLYFINGRTGPDTLLDSFIPWMPTQPYNSLPRMHPGEKIMLRIVNAGRELHPFHTHGNNTTMVARDGRVLESALGAGPDLSTSDFTIKTIPGETYDATFEWTGKGMGFDVYGHTNSNPSTLEPNEDPADHGKPLPVSIPNMLDLTFGEYYSGSPFLGKFGVLPVGHPALNQTAGYFHMFHSHTERELTNDDIFPGGMMTMLIIEPSTVPIP
jgi:FtsP/CotA-like multicopper oxidase with cupredoxin domain